MAVNTKSGNPFCGVIKSTFTPRLRSASCNPCHCCLARSGVLPRDRLIDLEAYRRIAQETGKATGAKGRGLYHPIRVALTARGSGPELIRMVPLIEGAAALHLPNPAPGCAQRAALVVSQMGGGS